MTTSPAERLTSFATDTTSGIQ